MPSLFLMYFSCYIQNTINKNHLKKPLCTFSSKIALILHFAPLWGLAYTWWEDTPSLVLWHCVFSLLFSWEMSSMEVPSNLMKRNWSHRWPFLSGVSVLFRCLQGWVSVTPTPLIPCLTISPAVRWDPEFSASLSALSLRCCMIFRIGFSFCRKRISDLDRHYTDFINCIERL